ncbi:MAG: M67 family metallopeptidase [Planctomycetes bacterium]|nr:M67 family metallopeptidase [Planctomycetota bacterium]MCW8136734.1 M67 family metallopeptidase [Planctomycetota bacterium]
MLTLTSAIKAYIEDHAVSAYPHECCGVLIGRLEGTVRTALEAARTGNLNTERAHDRFTLDPKDYMRIDLEARKRGLDIIGIYHSHPDHPAQPSATDLAAAWEGYSYVIVAVNKGKPGDFHSFELVNGEFHPEELRC